MEYKVSLSKDRAGEDEVFVPFPKCPTCWSSGVFPPGAGVGRELHVKETDVRIAFYRSWTNTEDIPGEAKEAASPLCSTLGQSQRQRNKAALKDRGRFSAVLFLLLGRRRNVMGNGVGRQIITGSPNQKWLRRTSIKRRL